MHNFVPYTGRSKIYCTYCGATQSVYGDVNLPGIGPCTGVPTQEILESMKDKSFEFRITCTTCPWVGYARDFRGHEC